MSAAAYPCVLADIGGTNARFGWLAAPAAAVEDVRVLPVLEHGEPASALLAYLRQAERRLGAAYRPPRRMAMALATALDGDRVELTNAHWSFSRAALQRELGLEALLLLNDFEALALSLPRLRAGQLRLWPGAGGAGSAPALMPARRAALAVVGPGTGLGVAGVLPSAQGWVPVAGEGGHMSLAPADALESDLLAWVRRSHEHVSAERLLSGIGLPLLLRALAAVRAAPAAVQRQLGLLTAAQILERGLQAGGSQGLAGVVAQELGVPGVPGQRPEQELGELCSLGLDVFCALLGGFAGNVALALGARGGVYIGGGIVPRLGDRFFASRFRERFEAKGRFRAYLQGIPVAVITDTLAALDGAALALEQSPS